MKEHHTLCSETRAMGSFITASYGAINKSIYRDIITQEKEDKEKFRQADRGHSEPETAMVNDRPSEG